MLNNAERLLVRCAYICLVASAWYTQRKLLVASSKRYDGRCDLTKRSSRWLSPVLSIDDSSSGYWDPLFEMSEALDWVESILKAHKSNPEIWDRFQTCGGCLGSSWTRIHWINTFLWRGQYSNYSNVFNILFPPERSIRLDSTPFDSVRYNLILDAVVKLLKGRLPSQHMSPQYYITARRQWRLIIRHRWIRTGENRS